MKLNIIVLLLALTHLAACQVDVKGEGKLNNPQGKVIIAKNVLNVGTGGEYLANPIEFSNALSVDVDHTWTWTAPSQGVLSISSPTYVTIGCSGNPFAQTVLFTSQSSPTFEQELPSDFSFEKDVTYSVTTRIRANDCFGANYSIGATFTANEN